MALQQEDPGLTEQKGAAASEEPRLSSEAKELLHAGAAFAGMLLLGTIVYGFLDDCVCGGDYLKCSSLPLLSSHETCLEVGGRDRTHWEALYMSIVTLSSVGFGDELPGSAWGRAFGIVWMPAG